ncbi:GTP-binding protein [Xinfangfangia sp. D13-10-4-6]|uniref:CobW family GTP-binding protein n=1 Tax=Pseudogemmobacter hezensis TaxID=2737662 RepID=UPI0015571C39|nr:CobW family GTP-binding protein [Pseudogemmobacter hezensis]NPD14024.1 GTP-binding protein [Pseudogemmobacter hezensis]
MSDGLLPLTILGGFLGAGKSSWARHQLHEGRFLQHHVIVNEAAGTPVDNLLLQGASDITVLAGGCACCNALPALLTELRRICDFATRANTRPIAGILLETSGLADPGRIAAAISTDPVLARRIRLAETLVLVDAQHGLAQLTTEALARAQVEAADRIVVTKVTAAPPQQTASLLGVLRQLAPAAGITGAEFGSPVDLPPPATPVDLPAITSQDPIRAYRLDLDTDSGTGAGWTDGGWIGLSTWLSALLHARGDDVIRVKGVVRSPAGRLLLQSVRRVVQPPEILPDRLSGPAPDEGFIILIGRNFDAELLQRSWRKFGV